MIRRAAVLVLVLLAVIVPRTSRAQADVDPAMQDHQQLRALLVSVRDAFNAGDRTAFMQYMHPTFSATMVTQELLTSRADLDQFLDKYFGGEQPIIQKLTMDPVADTLTYIIDGRFGVVHGTSTETYELSTGTQVLHTRWTAAVIKENGQWQVLALHNGTNFLDNPVLTVAKKASVVMAIGGLLIGLILGGSAGWFIRARRPQATA